MSEELTLQEIRLQKLARMRELGHDPFAVEEFSRTGTADDLLKRPDYDLPQEDRPTISFAGRVVSYRDMGKAGFAHLSDGDDKIQVYCRKDELGETGWELYRLLDLGDHVGVKGYLFLTKTGEKSIHVQELVPLSKSLQTLPLGKEKDGQQWYGLTDVEQRYRHRHLDLITNHEARKMLIDRAKIVSAVRRYFDGQGYLEVETPLLQVVAGGAAARPFTTHYNAYEMDVKLRISLELYLKRLICGDIPAVYEIGRVFRNEGVSNRHNPEFTLLEFYEAYTNLEGMMRRVEEMFAFVARQVYGTSEFAILNNGRLMMLQRATGWKAISESLSGTESRFVLGTTLFTAPLGPELYDEEEVIPAGVVLGEGFAGSIFSTNPRIRLHRSADGASVYSCEVPFSLFDSEGNRTDLAPCCFWLEDLFLTNAGHGDLPDEVFEGAIFGDFSKPWRRVDMLDEIARLSGLDRDDLSELARAKAAIRSKGIVDKAHQLGAHIDVDKEDNLGGLIEKLLEVFVEPRLQEPTFVVGYPIETSPLAKKDPSNPRMTRRFEGYVLGREVCNAFSEINDPIDQRERFEQQAAEMAKGDEEAHPYDEEFLYALEGGMPPTGGCGIGMERLAMILTGAEHIREVMMFPMMKPTEIES